MHDQKRLTKTTIFAMLLACALVALTFFAFNSDKLDVVITGLNRLEGRMHEEQNAQTRILSVTLPEEFDKAQSLLFKTTHTQVEVSVGRQTVHIHGQEGTPEFMKSPGAVWHVVDIPPVM